MDIVHRKPPSTVNFERFTGGRLSYIPGNVKLYESPGRAGGLPMIINTYLQDVLLKIISDKDARIFDFDMPQSMLNEIFAENNIQVINLLPHFREDARCLYMNDTHWTSEGYELAASIYISRYN